MLGIPKDGLQSYLVGFKDLRNIMEFGTKNKERQDLPINEALPLLRTKCVNYPLERIYNRLCIYLIRQ